MVLVSFRPLVRADFEMLAGWLAAPHVGQWWQSAASMDYVEKHYGPGVDGIEPSERFIIQAGGQPVGLTQRYLLGAYPEWASTLGLSEGAGIDYLIGEAEFVGRGIGSLAIRAFTVTVFARCPGASAIVAAPQQANVGSWKALERAGFERTWAGQLASDDPSDAGPAYVYCLQRTASP